VYTDVGLSITHFIRSSALEVDGAQIPTGHHPCITT